ncbi:MAG: hypothetical protein EBR40_10965 [Proteobacteria bacterium]|nr:hypothetical protein [Pseudomonadota bacterium]
MKPKRSPWGRKTPPAALDWMEQSQKYVKEARQQVETWTVGDLVKASPEQYEYAMRWLAKHRREEPLQRMRSEMSRSIVREVSHTHTPTFTGVHSHDVQGTTITHSHAHNDYGLSTNSVTTTFNPVTTTFNSVTVPRTNDQYKQMYSEYEKVLDTLKRGFVRETGTPCMWCGQLFQEDLLDAHEEGCGQ